ncbi:hypothetical protein [Streptomyces caeruleatus]|uniref:Secreted protein n=1 Tax=Streptomyces caeruleatus TaxID=661399 RepID=A0A101TI68_9ACTN|nr:hypothetical protein [Streptomyces caeruleatus]KUN92825.1 hypothetical protein AQJ67_39685 [Streptomyces caeruleatus]
MSWNRTPLAALAVCVLLLTGTMGCDSNATPDQGQNAASPAPVGKVVDDTDDEGRHYREVGEGEAPEVGIEVQPDVDGDDGSWDVRLSVRRFRFSPADAGERAVAGRGLAYLYVDDRLVTKLRTPEYRLPAGLVPRGTHQVTVRLYADDGTVWAVEDGPVQSTADITASEPDPEPAPTPSSEPKSTLTPPPSPAALSAPGTRLRTGGRCSPDRAGKA